MSSLSQIDSNGLGHRHHGRSSNASMSASEVAVNSYESLEAGLTIQTREGDVVNLSTSRYSEMNAYEYSSQGQITNKNSTMSAVHNVREITLGSGETFAFSVEGNLSEEELEDIESIVAGIDEIIGEMAQGDMADAVSKAMSMGSYASISMYEADISVERSYGIYAQTQSADYTQARGHGPDAAGGLPGENQRLPKVATDPGQSFMDKVATLLQEQKEESIARARQPLSQLFDHLINAQKAAREDAEKSVESVEEQPIYSFLETAAKDIDQMINEMVKDIFENTLNRFS